MTTHLPLKRLARQVFVVVGAALIAFSLVALAEMTGITLLARAE